jgi:hypothetical protein
MITMIDCKVLTGHARGATTKSSSLRMTRTAQLASVKIVALGSWGSDPQTDGTLILVPLGEKNSSESRTFSLLFGFISPHRARHVNEQASFKTVGASTRFLAA